MVKCLVNSRADYKLNTEQLIGTWDSKRLYRKIFQFTVADSGTSAKDIAVVTSNIVYWLPLSRASNGTLDLHYFVEKGTDVFRTWLSRYNDTTTRVNISVGTTYPPRNVTLTLIVYYTE